MKLITSSLSAFALVLLFAVPSHAQQDEYTLTFRLTVEGEPCPDATYWGFFGAPNSDDVNYVQLTDEDGDGVYTGTGTRFADSRSVAQIIQGTGTDTATTIGGGATFEVPGEPSTLIHNFGETQPDAPDLVPHVIVDRDLVFEASTAGCPAGLPDTGGSDTVPFAPVAAAVLLLAGGAVLRRRVWQRA